MPKLTKRNLFSIAAVAVLLAIVSCEQLIAKTGSSPAAVFILAGQSNMAGEARVDDAPAKYAALPPNVEFHDFTQGFDYEAHAAWYEASEPREPAQFVYTRPPGQFGPELGFATALSRTYPNQKFIFIKWALGGSSQQEWSPNWNASNFAPDSIEAVRGSLFQQAIQSIKSVDLQQPYKLEALLWFQGEKDTKTHAAASAYGDNMEALITAFQNELDAPDLSILIGKINPLTDRHPYVPLVHEQMEKIAASDSHIFLVSADGLSKKEDNVHYDAAGLIELGERFGDTWITNQADKN